MGEKKEELVFPVKVSAVLPTSGRGGFHMATHAAAAELSLDPSTVPRGSRMPRLQHDSG